MTRRPSTWNFFKKISTLKSQKNKTLNITCFFKNLMDVNKTVQANKLARELVKYGLVSSIDEGMSKATTMVKEGFDIASDQAAAQQPQQDASQQTGSYQPSEASDQSNDSKMFERKLNYLAKSFAEQFNKEIGDVKKQIDMINDELRNIRSQMAQARQIASQQQQPQQKLDSNGMTKKQREEATIKPRTGDLTPDDVELEDYFYFGSGGTKRR
jgi:DNA gyrase/topoisomerase IV subunit A